MSNRAKIITVANSKGGVGKSVISANMAWLLAKNGYKTALLDASLGSANLDILLNVKVDKNLLNFLKDEASIAEVVMEVKENLFLIPGDSGDEITLFNSQYLINKLFEESAFLEKLDYLIIDTSSAIDENMQHFLKIADEIVVVTTDEPTSLTEAYTTIKAAQKFSNEIDMVFNSVERRGDASLIFSKLKKVALQNIDERVKLNLLGIITYTKLIPKSSKKRALFCERYPNSLPSYQLNEIIENLIYKLEHKVLNPQVKKSFSVIISRLIEKF
jgi:flagellar biosynthesis protein FlhG